MLADWLASANLGHLLPRFEAEGVTCEDLVDLTDEDLRELGLTIGERKRFSRALAGSVALLVSGERRPLTLAFFDLVGSSALCETLDAEDMVELLRRYRECCCAAIDRYGGHVSHLLGDGVLAYFCYPVAHENDAERAVRAALEIAERVPLLEAPSDRPLAVRCGIATGRVVVTELFSGRAADKHAVTGSTANLAGRLQTLAPTNGVVLSAATVQHVEHLFECDHLGRHELKGFAEPVAAWRVRGARRRPWRFEEAPGRAVSPFIGRSAELAALEDFWRGVRSGAGGMLWLDGEAGVGKSRLAGRFVASLRERGKVRVMQLHGSEFDAHSPLHPFRAYLRQRLGLAENAGDAATTAALGVLLPDTSDAAVASVGAFLRLDVDTLGGDNAAIRERRRRALDALTAHFAAEASDRAVLLHVEDAHWLDPTSIELLAQVTAAASGLRLGVLATSRRAWTEVVPALDGELVRAVHLEPLGPDEVRTMVRASFGDEPVPGEVVARIAQRTDGVPLFVEELLRPMLGAAQPSDWADLATEQGLPTPVPTTLQEAFMARLDRLGELKETAQVASVLGRSIHLDTLADVSGRPRERMARRLEALCTAGVLRQESTLDPPAPERYTFAHALLRDAAYDSLLREQRQRLHARAAQSLLRGYTDYAAERPDVIAWHFTEGGQLTEALSHWLAAGRLAAARSSLHEARHVLECGARIAEALPASREVIAARLEFASLLGPVLVALCGPRSAESQRLYETAAALAEEQPESANDFAVLWGWWRLTRDFGVKGERAKMMLRVAERRGEPEMLLQAHHCNWARAFHEGDLAGCRRHIALGLAVYERNGCVKRPWLFGNHDAAVCGFGELALVLWMQGELHGALDAERRALALAERIDHAGTIAHALDIALTHRYFRRDVATTRAFAERIVAFAEDRGMREHRARGQLFLGWAMARAGEPAAGLAIFEQGYRRQRAIGSDEDTPYYICMLAEILNEVGQHERALTELLEVQAELARLGICNWEPEIWRLVAVTTRRARPRAKADAWDAFERAAASAARQGVVMLDLRNAVAVAEAGGHPAVAGRLQRLRAAVAEPDDSEDIVAADRWLDALAAARPAVAASASVAG